MRRRARVAVAAGAATVAGVALYARQIEPRRLVVREHALALRHWPARLDGLRVAVIADLHAGGPFMDAARVEAVVAAVAAARPDLVAIVGDLVDPEVAGGRRLEPDAVARRLARLRAPAGVAVVLGNHDWRHEGVAAELALRHAGLPPLLNAARRLEVRGGPLWVAGVRDASAQDARVGDALAGVPRDEPVLLLTHHPDVFGFVPARVALTVAGHLHGGQVNVPGLRARILPSRYGTRYRAGHVTEHGRDLYVSRGLGETGRPWRLGAPPELPVLRLGCAACPS